MKWIDRSQEIYEKNLSRVGETRISEEFLLFPRRIGNETRWLETAKIVQHYVQHFDHMDLYTFPTEQFYWEDMEWA